MRSTSHFVALCLVFAAACAPTRGVSPQHAADRPLPQVIPFGSMTGRVVTLPVTLAGAVSVELILDTGIGVNVVSTDLCRQLECVPDAEFTGRRTSWMGQISRHLQNRVEGVDASVTG